MAQGWYYVMNSPKWHYFKDDTRSICGRWWVPALNEKSLEDDKDESPDNCKGCLKKVRTLRKGESK